ncbi:MULTISPECIES: dihydrofolate reductase family protein [unclassified Streptomyces]|uniref:dihydrofolate reductase family protein n=1 Tax=unclassified Streptomyces TaxID=2593676 RepID=UPI0009393342|nr:dihydrofolate reductase family protein [Streptomyces sp. TSRI0107]OKJ88164.1 deaminase [Streptomyces sp. TSRI0107]
MRRLLLQVATSLDGYMEGPGRDISWHRVDEELHQHMNDTLRGMGGFLSGRVVYEMMAEFWPTADQDPEVDATMAEFAGIWRDMPKIVYSRTLRDADVGWNTTVVRDVVPEEVRALKEQPGGDLVLSGGKAAEAFLRHGLVDEFRIYVNPVLVGGGTPMFPESSSLTDLRLLESRTFGNGVVLLRYEVRGTAPRASA